MSDRQGLPPNSGQAQLHTVRVKNVAIGETVQVRGLSRGYGGIGTHYVRGQSRYCAAATCRTEWHKTEWFYRGYFAAEVFDAKEKLWLPCVWELTEQSELDLRDRYKRGQVWEFSRVADKDRVHPPCTGRLLGSYAEEDLPMEWDYRPVLMRMYHTAAIDVGVKNPMPPRLLLAASPFVPGFEAVPAPVGNTANVGEAEPRPRISLVEASKNGKTKLGLGPAAGGVR